MHSPDQMTADIDEILKGNIRHDEPLDLPYWV